MLWRQAVRLRMALSKVVYAVTDGYGPLSGSPGGEVWATTNAGVSLMTNVTQNVNPVGYAISSVAMDSSDGTGCTAYVGIMGFSTVANPTSHVWQTRNAGASWMDWSGAGGTELPDAPVNVLLVDSQAGIIYVGTDVGVFVSSTAAPTWTEVGPAPGLGVSGFLPNAPVTGRDRACFLIRMQGRRRWWHRLTDVGFGTTCWWHHQISRTQFRILR